MTASLRDAGWVQAARGGGLSHARVLLRHLLPNVLPQAVVLLATEIVLIMVAIVTLGYLGLGIQPPTPDWGTMIADGQQFVTTQWWLSAFPGFAVVLTGIALSLLGDGVGDVLRADARGVPRRGRRRGRIARASRAGRPRRADGDPGTIAAGAVAVRELRIESDTGSALVEGLSFSVEPGGALGIVGGSGSGKSLTLRALLGMLPRGTRVAGGELRVGGRVGMVFQDPLTALDPLSRVGVQLREAVEAAGVPRGRAAERVHELLRQVELPDAERMARSYPHELSGGQRQRLVIAMALAGDPAVLLCDEPTTALDVTVQRQVLRLLRRLRREHGLTLVFVSHDLAVVAEVCERIVVMRSGSMIESGSIEEVLGSPRDAYTRSLIAAVPRLPGRGDDSARRRGAAPGAQLDPAPAGARDPGATAPTAPGGPGPSPDPAPLLEVREATVRYGGFTAVDGVSFVLGRGGALGVVGESGSGKTSLARCLAGQLRLSGGEIVFDGAPLPAKRPRELARLIQLVPQDPASSLDPRMTVGQTLGELLRAHRLVPRSRVRARVAELLEGVRLDPALARFRPHRLSGGQRQRVALARALAVEPEVLVADEPTSALDVSVQASVIELLRELRRETGVALVLVSHDLGVVHELCDEVLVMRGGGVVERGGRGFFSAPESRYGRELLDAVPVLPLGSSPLA
ncbi:ATP-binding cassette domain-containing protein [Leucobacter massiliensis]|uniref:ATP-binding cassette domain-containing protein n=1 Tax=Leucobacter massiliensis TaxID=1686285 RepID=UPI003CCC0C72